MSAPALSPITLEVVRNGLYAIAEEMSVIVMRSARSPLLKEAGDLSSALTDAQGRLIAQGRDIPIHMGVMGFTVKEFLKRIFLGELLSMPPEVPPAAADSRLPEPISIGAGSSQFKVLFAIGRLP